MEIKLEDWIKQHNLDLEFYENKLLSLKDKEEIFIVLDYKKTLFDDDLFLNLSDDEYEIADSTDESSKTNFLFQFGDSWYWCPIKTGKSEDGELKYKVALFDFKYLGKSTKQNNVNSYLGIHSEYELLNSALNYKNAIKKAKFLNIKSLGICDENSLGGVLGFQLECKSNGIKPIIGETVNVGIQSTGDDVLSTITRKVKLFCVNEKGWFNLLNINNKMNTDYKGHHIPFDFLIEHGEGLICVMDYTNSPLSGIKDEKKYEKILKLYQESFDFVLFQFSSVEFSSETQDINCLENFKFYLKNYYSNDLPFCLIEDTYYLEPYESDCKVSVNDIGKKITNHSKNEWFKTSSESEFFIKDFFEESKWTSESFIKEAENGTELISSLCSFEITLEGAKLPKFEIEGELIDSEESKDILKMLCEEGFKQKVEEVYSNKNKVKIYRERMEREYDVISGAGFADYFLILWDTVNFANDNGYMIGTGRGSVGGSLLAYLIGITRIDPIKYDLLFERFLNESRFKKQYKYVVDTGNEKIEVKEGGLLKINGSEFKYEEIDKIKHSDLGVKSIKRVEDKRLDSLPDIDIDFTTKSRDIVKNYLKNKYGNKYTCSVGTYGRLKLRQTFKDLAKIEGVKFVEANELTKKIDDQHEYEFFDLFKYAKKDPNLYRFIQTHPEMINKLKVVLNNPKSVSIHPSAVLVLPKQDEKNRDRSLDNWIPIRSIDGMNISEWEGKFCDIFGLLKNDILGLAQLDKFTYCLELIKKNHGVEIDLDNIDLEDNKTFKLFQKGFNEDVFQFGSTGLKQYSKEVRPDCIDDLIAMAALYRPGPMSSNAHTDFAKIKHGELEPDYDWGMEEITKPTNGLWVYQEQIMQAFVRAGFTLVESDSVRTIMKKFDKKKMSEIKDKFVNGLANQIGKGGVEIANKIFDKLVGFSSYGFNKSHSAAYALIAYQSQWLKANYPLEFWTTTLNFASEDDIPYVLKEFEAIKRTIKNFDDLKISSADINLSSNQFGCSVEDKRITWSLVKIKGVGDAAVEAIINTRQKESYFKSISHFLETVPKNKVNKSVVTRLILGGAFDNLEEIENPSDRTSLLLDFYDIRKIDPNDCKYLNDKDVLKDWKWRSWEKEYTGFGMIDYKSLLRNSVNESKYISRYISAEDFQDGDFYDMKKWDYSKLPLKVICGTFREYQERQSKNGKEFLNIWIDSNSIDIKVTLWGREGELDWEYLKSFEGKKVMISGGACSNKQFGNCLYINKGIKDKPYIQEI